MASEGPNNPTAAVSVDIGGVNWVNPTRALQEGGGTASTLFTENDNSDSLRATGFNFSDDINDDADIVGISVSVRRTNTMVVPGSTRNVKDYQAFLLVAGSIAGSNLKNLTNWSTSGFTVVSYGGEENTFGVEGLKGSDVKAVDFGFALACQSTIGMGTRSGDVDLITMTVYYRNPATSAPAIELRRSSVIHKLNGKRMQIRDVV